MPYPVPNYWIVSGTLNKNGIPFYEGKVYADNLKNGVFQTIAETGISSDGSFTLGFSSSQFQDHEEIKLMFKDLSVKSNNDQNRSREQEWMRKRMIIDHLRHGNFPPRVAVRMGFYFYKDSKPWIYEEGNFLLNQLLDGKYDVENIMRQLYELLDPTRQFRYDLQDSLVEYENMVNDIILNAMNYIATEFERKGAKNKKQT